MEIRFHSPYRHGFVGLMTEILTFIAFIIAVGLLAVVASWAA